MGSVPGRTRAACARYLAKVTGLSRAQVTRAITQLTRTGLIEDRRKAPAKPFARRYTAADIRLLAEVDARHGTRSGLATRQLCERRYRVFGDTRYARLAGISNGHRYRLRQHPTLYLDSFPRQGENPRLIPGRIVGKSYPT